MTLAIRPFTSDDIDFAVAQTTREGWATGVEMFETHLAHDPNGAFIACAGGRAVGMVTTTCYSKTGWIGNLIVAPEHRSHGIGRILMEHGLRRLTEAGVTTVRLDGDPPAIPLYRSLGFADEHESLRYRWHGDAAPRAEAVETLERRLLPAVISFDNAHFGDDRGRLLGLMLEHSSRAFVIRSEGAIRGYVLVETTNLGLHTGPCLADSEVAARRLLGAVLATAGGKPVAVGIPAPNETGRALLESLGFTPTPPSLRMALGPPHGRGDLENIFAIAGGAVG